MKFTVIKESKGCIDGVEDRIMDGYVFDGIADYVEDADTDGFYDGYDGKICKDENGDLYLVVFNWETKKPEIWCKIKSAVKDIRSITGLSQRAFATAYNIPCRTIENWETGKAIPPRYVIDLLRFKVEADYSDHKYSIRDSETGTVIDTLASLSEAKQVVASFEEDDKSEGNYTPDFYEIYDETAGKVII